MDYLKQNVKNFKIDEYFKSINAEVRETAENDFKELMSKIGKFEISGNNKPLLQFAARMRDTRFKVLTSSVAEEYWNSIISASIERKRLQEHLYSEQSVADVILDYAKKRHKSNKDANNMSTEANEASQESSTSTSGACENSQGSLGSINETNIWQIWSFVLSCVDTCDDPETDVNDYSLEHLGIVQLGDGIGNNTTRKLFSKNLVTSSNNLIRKEQVNIFEEFHRLYNSFYGLFCR